MLQYASNCQCVINPQVEKYLTLIAKRLAGEITDEEQIELKDWLDESRDNELLFHRMDEAWRAGALKPVVTRPDEAFARISARLGLDEFKDDGAQRSGKRRRLTWYSIAAAFTLSLCLAGWWWKSDPVEKAPVGEMAEEVVVQSNPKGQKSTIVLPDGSKVKLNSDSYLEYRENFRSEREVRLVGEAFFDVVHDSAHPFIVHSGDVTIRVLGTSFNVQAFPFEESMSVAVVTGRVFVENASAGFSSRQGVLLPREMVRIDHKTGTFEKGIYDPEAMLAWKDGILTFDKASFNEIVDRLERWYGVKFVIKRTRPITRGFTGRYENPSLKLVLEGMSFSSEFKFEIKGDTVVIY